MFAVMNGCSRELDDQTLNLTLYGFGTYSSFSVYQGKALGWSLHLQRLQRDAKEFLGLEVSPTAISDSVLAFLKEQDSDFPITCRVMIFPGDFNLGAPQKASDPQILVIGRIGSSVSSPSMRLKMYQCKRAFAQYKITNISVTMHLRGKAKNNNYDDALFQVNSLVSEGTTWNIFFIKNGHIFTPRLSEDILPGITRQIIINMFQSNVTEKNIKTKDVQNFDAAFATNAVTGIVPISSIDGYDYFDTTNVLLDNISNTYQGAEKEMII